MLPSNEPAVVVERKFSGTRNHLQGVLSVVRANCVPDRMFPVGHINSIYFDTIRMRSYEEKANGDHLKSKVRLRWYGLPQELPAHVPAFLEIKARIGIARRKARLDLMVPRSFLLETDFEDSAFHAFLASHSEALGEPLGVDWFPVAEISYDRERYVDFPSDSRVSIDWNITALRYNRRMFPWAVPVALEDLVCEFKNQYGTPPLWSEPMQQLGLRLGSFSKYGECMRRIFAGIP